MNLKYYINFFGIKFLKKFFLVCLMLDNYVYFYVCIIFYLLNMIKKLIVFLKE